MDDCIIIGGGPAGLTAAIYLARFHLATRLFDCGTGRATTIPCTHNHAGFPEGISGDALVARMRDQARRYGTVIDPRRVSTMTCDGDGFVVTVDEDEYATRTVLLATGVVNRRPDMDAGEHDAAVRRGLIRYCPVCDGYEVTDRRIGVIGTGDHGMQEALFLRGYSRDVTLVAPGAEHDLDAACRAKLDDGGIVHVDGPCSAIRIEDETIAVDTARGTLRFDTIYPALGSTIRSELAVSIGAAASDIGCLEVDAHQRTTVPGLFAAGDVVLGLDQISNAMGQAGVAATTIRNLLDERSALRR